MRSAMTLPGTTEVIQKDANEVISREIAIVRKLANVDDSVEIVFNDRGWTSRVYILGGGTAVFKFPRIEEVKLEYALEVAAYDAATLIGGVLLPRVEWRHPDWEYLGYRGVVGRGLDSAISLLPPLEMRQLGRRLGTFLNGFHRGSIEGARLISPEDEIEEWRHKLELCEDVLRKEISNLELSKLRELVLRIFPERLSRLGFTVGLCHGDLGFWNMIYGLDGELGIIDFGDVGRYDTSKDFAGLSDLDMLEGALETYGGDISREKIEIRKALMPVLDLPFFVGKNDQAGINSTVKRIKDMLPYAKLTTEF